MCIVLHEGLALVVRVVVRVNESLRVVVRVVVGVNVRLRVDFAFFTLITVVWS